MNRWDILKLTPMPMATAIRVFAAKAAKEGAVEVPGESLEVADAFDRAIDRLPGSRRVVFDAAEISESVLDDLRAMANAHPVHEDDLMLAVVRIRG